MGWRLVIDTVKTTVGSIVIYRNVTPYFVISVEPNKLGQEVYTVLHNNAVSYTTFISSGWKNV
jgi:hypothetical protein